MSDKQSKASLEAFQRWEMEIARKIAASHQDINNEHSKRIQKTNVKDLIDLVKMMNFVVWGLVAVVFSIEVVAFVLYYWSVN